jgi:hypothetical protein
MVDDLEALEKKIFGRMKRVVKHHPAWSWLERVKGMGPTLSTKILGLVADAGKFDTVSKLWAFSGYGLKEGQRQRPVKGEKLSYNRRLKTALYLAGDSFIKSRSPYRAVYDDAKAKYREAKQVEPILRLLPDLDHDSFELTVLRETPDGKKKWDKLIKDANKAASAERDEACWSDGHVDNAARRKMVKLFLSHLWVVWREAEGLPTRAPYAHEYLGHTSLSDPWSFVD